ncbi:MAG: ABC transporter permease [Planctomycetes bacterium]|nr:ABC transporter permease [Planctomycetota bacterium]
MRAIVKLLLAHWRRHPLRLLLTTSAVTMAVAMVTVVIGAQTAAVSTDESSAQRMSGGYALLLSAGTDDDVENDRSRASANPPLPPLAPPILPWLRAQPEVRALFAATGAMVELAKSRDPETDFRTRGSIAAGHVTTALYGTDNATPPRPLVEGRWLEPGADADDDSVAIDQNVARRLKVALGDQVQVASIAGWHTVRIRGIVDAPANVKGLTGLYVAPAVYARLLGCAPEPNRVAVALHDPGVSDAFAERCEQFVATLQPPTKIESLGELMAPSDVSTAYGGPHGGGAWYLPLMRDASMKLALVAGLFIIFNTFSMGVQERIRQLAMLRAIGLTQLQVLVLLLLEAASIATFGWLVGVGIGATVLQGDATWSYFGGVTVQLAFPLAPLLGLGALVAYGSVALAIALPAYNGARLRPLEGMARATQLLPSRAPHWLLPFGLLLIVVNPWAATTTMVPDPLRSTTLVPLSFVTALLGTICLLPWLLRLCERSFAAVAGRLLALNPRLLARQLSNNLWRTVGCVAALLVGLGLYIVIQVWGRSMAVPFLLTEQIPDAVVHVLPDGVPDDRMAAIAKLPGAEAMLPIRLENPLLANLPEGTVIDHVDFFSKDVMYFGCELHGLLDPDEGMIHAEFVRGSAATAAPLLAAGGSCLISDNLYRRFPDLYDVGKAMVLDSGDPRHARLTYQIAGVVKMDGWHLFMRYIGMRRNTGRCGGMIFVPPATARADYPDSVCKTLWYRLAEGVDPGSLEKPLTALLSRADGAPVSDDGLRDGEAYLRIVNARTVGRGLQSKVDNVIKNLSTYPLWALLLAGAAVVNTLLAAIRARSWEIGILRSIGQTRGQIVRMVLAEGLLTGLLAGLVSLLFGLGVSYTGTIAGSRSMDVTAPFVVPWPSLLLGLALALGVCVAASVVPALLAARREPSRLLQEGRAVE